MKEGDTALFFLHGLKNERVTWLSTGFGVLHYYTAATLTPELRRQAGRQAGTVSRSCPLEGISGTPNQDSEVDIRATSQGVSYTYLPTALTGKRRRCKY